MKLKHATTTNLTIANTVSSNSAAGHFHGADWASLAGNAHAVVEKRFGGTGGTKDTDPRASIQSINIDMVKAKAGPGSR